MHPRPGSGSYYFELRNAAGETVLTSTDYTDRDSCVDAIRKAVAALRAGNIAATGAAGDHHFTLSDGSNNVIGRSTAFAAAEEARAAADRLTAEAATTEEFSVDEDRTVVRQQLVPVRLTAEEIAARYDFTLVSLTRETGFELYKNPDTNYFYYFFNNDAGDMILMSRRYKNPGRRVSNIRSVISNGVKEARYERMEEGGQHFFILKSSNGTEIARSPMFASAEARDAAIQYLIAHLGEYKEQYKKQNRRSTEETQEYDFGQTGTSKDVGFDAFKNNENSGYYFHFNNESGRPILYSQGYQTEKSRDNGLKSVIKNGTREQRYKVKEDAQGFYFVLLAGNRVEIARSRYYQDHELLENDLAYLKSHIGGYAERYGVALKQVTDIETSSFNLTVDLPEPEPTHQQDEYLDCDGYTGPADGFHRFQENGEFYFGYSRNGRVLLRSQGYVNAAGRDNGIESVRKNGQLDERWSFTHDDNGHYWVLKAGNNQEIARSCPYATEDAMQNGWREVQGAFAPLGVSATNRNIDEYLECDAYLADVDGFHTFEKDGEHFFGYVHNGKTYLRSESYPNKAVRDNGMRSVQKNAPLEERWKTIEEDGEHFYILRAGNNQEIARSCPYASAAAMMTDWNWIRGERSPIGYGSAMVAGAMMSGFAIRQKAEAEEAERARLAAEAEAKRQREAEEARLRAEAEAKRKAEAERLRLEAEAKRKAEAERLRLEAEAKRKREAEAAAAAAAAAAALAAKKKQEEEAARAAAEAEAKRKAELEARKKALDVDNYLPCREYEVGSGYQEFKQNSQFYFAFNDDDGNVILRSEGYNQPAARNKGRDWVRRQAKNYDNYEFKRTAAGKHYFRLMANEKTEIARSCYYDDEKGMLLAAAPFLQGNGVDADGVLAAGFAGWAAYRAGWPWWQRKQEEEAAAVAAAAAAEREREEKAAAVAAAATAAAAAATATPKVVKTAPAAVPPPRETIRVEEKTGGGWWWWLLGLAALALLAWLLFRGCDGCGADGTTAGLIDDGRPDEMETPVVAPAEEEPEAVVEPEPAPAEPLGPDGAALGLVPGSFAYNMANFLSDPNSTAPGYFCMDDVRYPRNEASLNDVGVPQVAALAQVLRAYPNARVNLVGHIDDDESDAYNGKYADGTGITLSEIRGRCIYKRLNKRGISTSQLSYDGRDSAAMNGASADCKGNRRVTVQVTRK